jgi:thiol-disulfide isomerase/thioredoxin
MQINKKTITIALVAVVGVIIVGGFVYLDYSGKLGILNGGNDIQVAVGQQVAEKAINYINENILKGNGTASLVNVGEENGYYKIKFSLQGNEMDSYVTKDGKLFFPEVINLDQVQPVAEATKEVATTIGSFSISNDEICMENGKPIVYFFGAETCPHCRWEYPILNEVIKKFGNAVSYHDNKDKDTEADIFNKYSTGGIPTIVAGCKYYRVGSGESGGAEQETKNLTAIICKITGNNPAEICSGVEDLVNQIQ